MLIAKHVAVTSTLPVFEQYVPSRPDVPQKALDMLSDEAAKAYHARNRERVAKNAAEPVAHDVSTGNGI